jgi:hypothetical protein
MEFISYIFCFILSLIVSIMLFNFRKLDKFNFKDLNEVADVCWSVFLIIVLAIILLFVFGSLIYFDLLGTIYADPVSDIDLGAKAGTNTNVFNFNTLNLNEKYEYIKLKFFNKALEPNIPFLDWFIQLLANTDGSQNNVDQVLETNLNHIQKIQREAQLNSHSFSRIRPFLINKIDTSANQIPNIVPYKGFPDFEE